MTLDTAALRTEMRVIRSYWEHGTISEQDTSATIERCFALCDALDGERERTRVLREALQALAAGSVRVQRQWFRDHGMPEVAERYEAYSDALARAALAIVDAGGDGGTQ